MSFWNSILEGKLADSKFFIEVKKMMKKLKNWDFRVLKGILAENLYMWSYKYIEECRDTRTSAVRALHRWLGWQFTRCLEFMVEKNLMVVSWGEDIIWILYWSLFCESMSFWNSILEGKLAGPKLFRGGKKIMKKWKIEIF